MNTEHLAFLQEHVMTIDGQRPERLDEIRDRVRTARRRRATLAIGGAATTAVLVATALLVNQTPPATPEPAEPPSLQTLAPDPFLSDHAASFWGPRVRVVNAQPRRLNHCISDPHTWGALNTQAATYVDPSPAADQDSPRARLNEYVLQYADPASAHRAIHDALRQVRDCPTPPGVAGKDRSGIEREPGYNFDEYFANQQTWISAPNTQPTHMYTLRVARADNILIVIEDTEASDRSYLWLAEAVHQAVPRYKK